MKNKEPAKTTSLDDLLQSNRARFDKIFADQNEALQILDLRQRPPEPARTPPGKAEPEPVTPAKTAGGKTPALPPAASAPEVIKDPASAATGSAEPAAATTPARFSSIAVDRIENALASIRHEMAAVLSRAAPSAFMHKPDLAALSDAEGRMIAGRSDAYIARMLQQQAFAAQLQPGDVILQSDPYLCAGAVSHTRHWLVTLPVFYREQLLGFSSMCAAVPDAGGSAPGSTPAAATSVFGEGIRIPPLRLYEKGELNRGALDIILNNTRTPQQNCGDLMALVAACRTGGQRLAELCRRFGLTHYLQACATLLERTQQTMRRLIVQHLPEEPQSFEDCIDDDGCGNGPFKLKLTLWREGEHAYFDWTGTSPQAQGPVNFYLHDDAFRMFVGIYMAAVFGIEASPSNNGFYELVHVSIPPDSLLRPGFPAALSNYRHTLMRQFDVLGGALGKTAPAKLSAAGYGASARFQYSAHRGRFSAGLRENIFGGLPGRPAGDGLDGHSWWPLLQNTPAEDLENDFPVCIEKYASIADSGGAGLHRGGNGIEKIYLLLESGTVSIHDERHRSRPWGILGGKAGECSAKYLQKENGERQSLAAKTDRVEVQSGDRIIFRTAGGGGWGDPLQRDPLKVRNDVARGLVSVDAARQKYGVVLRDTPVQLDIDASRDLRDTMKHERKPLPVFDFGRRPAKLG